MRAAPTRLLALLPLCLWACDDLGLVEPDGAASLDAGVDAAIDADRPDADRPDAPDSGIDPRDAASPPEGDAGLDPTDASTAPVPFCGDGIVQAGEQCDDGNARNADGCDVHCRLEPWMELRRHAATNLGNRLVYDAARGQVMVFGGDGTRASNETALWTGAQWVHAPASYAGAALPPARAGMSVAYDAARREVVLFGGMGAGTLGDTWVWDGRHWRLATPTDGPSPSPRVWAGMAWDAARERIVLFGGQSFHEWSPMSNPDSLSFTQSDEVWEWDGARWDRVEPLSVERPSARSFHAMTWDPVAGRVLVHGGLSGLATQRDLWAWDGERWQELTLDGDPLYQHALSFDPVERRLVVSGGGSATVFGFAPSVTLREITGGILSAFASTDLTHAGHLSAFDVLRGQLLFPRQPTQALVGDTLDTIELTRPTGYATCYDPLRGRTVLFDGSVEEFDGERWHAVPDSSGPPVPVSDRTTDRFPMVYDEARRVAVLFALGETWLWDGEQWVDAAPSVAPPPREGTRMVWDRTRQEVVLFGGVGEDEALGDTWTWDGTEWQPRSPADSPSPRFDHAMAWDAVRGRAVLFGGDTGEATGSFAADVLGDTWEWDGENWQERTLAVSPPPRRLASMVYDPFTATVLLRGGRPDTFGWYADFWELDARGWRKRILWQPEPAGGAPRGFAAGSMAYHSTTATLVSGGAAAASTFMTEESTLQVRYGGLGTGSCRTGFDGDGDGLIGCSDPDCWAWCTPLCPPDAPCDAGAPRCGDGLCNPFLENGRLCPEDCPAAPTICGDFHCDEGESAAGCPGDCRP